MMSRRLGAGARRLLVAAATLCWTCAGLCWADIFLRGDLDRIVPGTEGIDPGPNVQLDHRELANAFLGYMDLTDSRFDFSNLTNADLRASRLIGANLTGANFTGAYLDSSTLTGANFAGANLTRTDLSEATLTSANLTGAIVTGARFFDTTSRGFTKEQLYSTASYQQRNLQGIQLNYNDLSGWDISNQNLTDANLSSILTGANLSGTIVTGAFFGDTTFRGFTKEQLYSTASYQQKNLAGIQFWYSDLSGWDFGGQNLTNSHLTRSTLTNANLSGANLTNANLRSTTFERADLSFADTRGAFGLDATAANARNMIWPNASIQGLDLAAGEQLVVRDYAGNSTSDDHLPANVVRIVGRMNISPTGQLDLRHNSLIVKNGNLADVTAQVAQGFHGGAWNGFGITSSAAASDPRHIMALGVLANEAGDGTPIYDQFAGMPVTAQDVLVRLTFYGDADLNGHVDGDDLVSFNVGYLNHLGGWANGDFDFNGVVDGDDLTLLLMSYAGQDAELSAGGVHAVPEPASVLLALLGGLGLVAVSISRRTV